MTFALSSFAHKKMNNRTTSPSGMLLAAMLPYAYKGRPSDVIIIKFTAGTHNLIPYKTYISEFSHFEN